MLSSADGNFEVSLATKATLYHTGLVEVKDKYEEHGREISNGKSKVSSKETVVFANWK